MGFLFKFLVLPLLQQEIGNIVSIIMLIIGAVTPGPETYEDFNTSQRPLTFEERYVEPVSYDKAFCKAFPDTNECRIVRQLEKKKRRLPQK